MENGIYCAEAETVFSETLDRLITAGEPMKAWQCTDCRVRVKEFVKDTPRVKPENESSPVIWHAIFCTIYISSEQKFELI